MRVKTILGGVVVLMLCTGIVLRWMPDSSPVPVAAAAFTSSDESQLVTAEDGPKEKAQQPSARSQPPPAGPAGGAPQSPPDRLQPPNESAPPATKAKTTPSRVITLDIPACPSDNLVETIRTGDDAARVKAARALARRDKEVEPAISKLCRMVLDPKTRIAALEALEIARPELLQPLRKLDSNTVLAIQELLLLGDKADPMLPIFVASFRQHSQAVQAIVEDKSGNPDEERVSRLTLATAVQHLAGQLLVRAAEAGSEPAFLSLLERALLVRMISAKTIWDSGGLEAFQQSMLLQTLGNPLGYLQTVGTIANKQPKFRPQVLALARECLGHERADVVVAALRIIESFGADGLAALPKIKRLRFHNSDAVHAAVKDIEANLQAIEDFPPATDLRVICTNYGHANRHVRQRVHALLTRKQPRLAGVAERLFSEQNSEKVGKALQELDAEGIEPADAVVLIEAHMQYLLDRKPQPEFPSNLHYKMLGRLGKDLATREKFMAFCKAKFHEGLKQAIPNEKDSYNFPRTGLSIGKELADLMSPHDPGIVTMVCQRTNEYLDTLRFLGWGEYEKRRKIRWELRYLFDVLGELATARSPLDKEILDGLMMAVRLDGVYDGGSDCRRSLVEALVKCGGQARIRLRKALSFHTTRPFERTSKEEDRDEFIYATIAEIEKKHPVSAEDRQREADAEKAARLTKEQEAEAAAKKRREVLDPYFELPPGTTFHFQFESGRKMSMRIDKREMVNSQECTRVELNGDPTGAKSHHIAVRPDSVRIVQLNDKTPTNIAVVRWLNWGTKPPFASVEVGCRLTARFETVRVPVGERRALYIEDRTENGVVKRWFYPGEWIVKEQVELRSGSVIYSRALERIEKR